MSSTDALESPDCCWHCSVGLEMSPMASGGHTAEAFRATAQAKIHIWDIAGRDAMCYRIGNSLKLDIIFARFSSLHGSQSTR